MLQNSHSHSTKKLVLLSLKQSIYLTNMEQKKHKKRKKYRKKCPTTGRKGKHQYGVLLSRYNLAYVGKDTVNQAAKVTHPRPPPSPPPTHTTGERELESVLPKILCGAIEDVYQTPFRMLGNLGKKAFNDIKRKILKQFNCI